MIWLICVIALLALGFWSLLPKRASRRPRSADGLDESTIDPALGGDSGVRESTHSFDHGNADGGHGGGGADGGSGH
jgi:hypothetical protein